MRSPPWGAVQGGPRGASVGRVQKRFRFAVVITIALVGATAAPASAVELARTDYDTGGAPLDPEIAGLDSQNGPDVVVGNQSPTGVQVFLNNTQGGLGAPTSLPLTCQFASTPQVELGAVNIHDTFIDIITGCLTGFRGNGDGTFGAGYNSGSLSRTVVMDLGDIDTTTASIPDIATTCGDGNSHWLLASQAGNTDGTFGGANCVPGTINPGDGTYETIDVEVEIYNLANDAHTDVVYFSSDRTNIIGNEWNPDLYPSSGYKPHGSSRPTNGTNGVAVETGDLDGDSDPDWVAAMRGPPAMLSVFEHQANGFPAGTQGQLINTIEDVEDLELADVNRDGILDAVTVSQNRVGVQLGNGDRTFKAAQTFPFAAGAGAGHDLATGDLNGDGLDDIVATTYTTADVSVFLSVATDDTGPPLGANPPGGPDRTEPDLGSSTAKSRQKLGKALKVTVLSNEDASVTASATASPKGKAKRAKQLKFKPVSAQAKAGTSVALKLKPSKKTARKLEAAARATAQITLRATDAAGNTATEALSVKLR